MPVTNGYCTEAQAKAYIGSGITAALDKTSMVHDAINAASRAIDKHCGRIFYDTGSATARRYVPRDGYYVVVDDFSTTTGLIVETDEDGDGTYETTWAATDYELEPLDGIVDGTPGWPFRRIFAVDRYVFPTPAIGVRRYGLKVTARWGWGAVPEPVRQSCLQVAAEEYRRKDAPFGVAQTLEFGPLRLSADTVRAVSAKLAPFVVTPVIAGAA